MCNESLDSLQLIVEFFIHDDLQLPLGSRRHNPFLLARQRLERNFKEIGFARPLTLLKGLGLWW